MPITIPLGLKNALETGECVLFIGAGIGGHLLCPDGKSLPNGQDLSLEMCAHYKIDPESTDLTKVSKIVELRKGRPELEQFIRKRLTVTNVDSSFQWLSTIRWKAVFTTNYDYGLLRAYELNPAPLQKPVPISVASEYEEPDLRFDVPVYYLHGTLFGGNTKLLVTNDDYATFGEKRHMLFERLKLSFASSTFLYIGYSNKDPNWNSILAEISKEFYPKSLPQSFRVDPYSDLLDNEILEHKNITTISSSFSDFVTLSTSELKDFRLEHDTYKNLQNKIPLDLIDSFNKNPVATARLVGAWQYVNQADFSTSYNVSEFLKGNRPSWNLISRGDFFKRDIYNPIFGKILDILTGSMSGLKTLTLLGPAGYGTTTLLMTLAVGLVREGVENVYYLKGNKKITEGDLEFAISRTKSIPVFLIDDAADHIDDISSCIARLREADLIAVFVFADRKNEWLSRKPRISSDRFDIEPLSDVEIDALIDYLTKHNALNKLSGLERTIQQSEIRNRNGKELLVAMREATEGSGFDAIVESEYRQIDGDILRKLYLAVCCMHQFGASLRDGALAQVLGLEITEFYTLPSSSLEGVVHFETIDETNGTQAARSRHRVIAQIVWERCGDNQTKENVLLATLESLNLTYRSDAKALDQLIRSDRLIDSIKSLDSKIRFFETACRKDPDSPYVRQHFARMLLRAGEHNSALAQINEGIRLGEGKVPKVLFHTQGLILTELALKADGLEIARRHMVKAEESFKKLILTNDRDEFGYQGLTGLYLMWARKVGDEAETAVYISKAEEQISIGLRKCKNKDSLWICSSEIENFLGNQPSRISALESAVRDAPSSIIARYLLARQYRAVGRYVEAADLLRSVLENNPDEYRSYLEFSLSTYEGGGDVQVAANTLSLSKLYGHGDPRYLATHAGMLYLAGRLSESEAVYAEASRREMPYSDLNKIHFYPRIKGVPLFLEGSVVAIKASLSTIEVNGFPPLYYGSSKTRGVLLAKGSRLKFELVFSGRGPQPINVEIISPAFVHPQPELK